MNKGGEVPVTREANTLHLTTLLTGQASRDWRWSTNPNPEDRNFHYRYVGLIDVLGRKPIQPLSLSRIHSRSDHLRHSPWIDHPWLSLIREPCPFSVEAWKGRSKTRPISGWKQFMESPLESTAPKEQSRIDTERRTERAGAVDEEESVPRWSPRLWGSKNLRSC